MHISYTVTYTYLHNGKYLSWSVRGNEADAPRSVHSVIISKCRRGRLLATSRSVAFFQSQPLLMLEVEILQGPLFAPQASLKSCRGFGGFLSSPTAAGFGILRWSVARRNLHVVQFSCLFEPHAMGAISTTVFFTSGAWVCSFPSVTQ